MSEQTVFQLRLTVEQKERWRAAANGMSLSEWIRDVCDWAASDQNPYSPGFVPVRVMQSLREAGLERSGAAEELREVAAHPKPAPVVDNFNTTGPSPAGVSWPMLPPEDEHAVLGVPLERVSLAPDCVNKHLHWALKQGEPCRFCKGTL